MASKRKVTESYAKSARTGVSPAQVEDGMTSLDVEALRRIVEMLEASEVTHLSWKRGDERLVIRRGPQPTIIQQASSGSPVAVAPVSAAEARAPAHAPAQAAAAAPAPAATSAAAAPAKAGQLVTSPFVGTFYRTPAPDQPPFVDLGTVVKKGQVLCIVEAMKLMNEIEAETGGKITEVLAENGQPVEFGQPLFRIEPA